MIKDFRQLLNQLLTTKDNRNQKLNNFSKYIRSYEIVFSYSNYMNLEKREFLYNISDANLTCIFCLKKKPFAFFNDDAHVIPYLLGNKFLMHHEECEACNKKFGANLETELASFSEKFRVINGYKNRSTKKPNYLKYQAKSQKALLKMEEIDNKMRLEVTGERSEDILEEHGDGKISLSFETIYRDSDVYKAFMKTVYGVIHPKYHKDYSQLRS